MLSGLEKVTKERIEGLVNILKKVRPSQEVIIKDPEVEEKINSSNIELISFDDGNFLGSICTNPKEANQAFNYLYNQLRKEGYYVMMVN